jgi:tetratricopeptide (TPR) repeat protein
MDAAVDTTAEFADLAFADVESGLAAADEALQANGPAAAMRAWTTLANQFPHDPRIFRQAIPALVGQRAWVEAEQVAIAATTAFPRDIVFAAQWAEIAQKRRDWDEALDRWAEVRARFPRHAAGFIGAASTLREMDEREEAEALLERAMGLFPEEPRPLIDWAAIALDHRDYAEALFRFERMRRTHGGEGFGYTGAARAFRELGQLAEAEALLEAAIQRFPDDIGAISDHALVAHKRGDLPEAALRWERLRARAPDRVEAYFHGAEALRQQGKVAEADSLLEAGIKRFPQHFNLVRQHADDALRRQEFAEARARFQALRERFPNEPAGYHGGAWAALKQFMMDEAQSILEEAMRRWPDAPNFLLDYALIPVHHPKKPHDWDEGLARLARVRARFPAFEPGYVRTIEFLRSARRLDELQAFATEATARLPASVKLANHWARAAEERADWPEAVRRFQEVARRFPDDPAGYAGLATALAASGRTFEADRELEKAMRRWPAERELFAAYAMIAVRQSDWRAALRRWEEAAQRFPDYRGFAERAFEARLRVVELDAGEDDANAASPMAEGTSATASRNLAGLPVDDRAAMRDMMLQFESLGGTLLGCEFGGVQRHFGAEPLGLLRWTELGPKDLIAALEARFEGVGLPENTELGVFEATANREYRTRDRRFYMSMHTFIAEASVARDKMLMQACRRLEYLSRKLIEDLESGSKIFVYKITARNLTEDEIDRLHAAMRRYGDNMLLYVRYQDESHPNGTVQLVRPGLMIGYIDRFEVSQSGEQGKSAIPSWMIICKEAYRLWQASKAAPAIASATQEPQTLRDLMLNFESLGGHATGCEFGIVQRECGAEPLGLLRWSNMPPQNLIAALEQGFPGVGLPEHTMLSAAPIGGVPEWHTRDTRFEIGMRAFVRADEVPYDTMLRLVCRRLQFLARKLIDDLSEARKIFVYRLTARDLSDEEIDRLHAAIRRYGPNSLLYARYANERHPNGTVEIAKPGLMIGYMDHFIMSRSGELIGRATPAWVTLCKRAWQLWRQSEGAMQ